MDGLIVTPLRDPRGATDSGCAHVRALDWPVPQRRVLIERRSLSGHDDRIVRPASEAVTLFSRFTIEKFGVEPVRPAVPRLAT